MKNLYLHFKYENPQQFARKNKACLPKIKNCINSRSAIEPSEQQCVYTDFLRKALLD